MNLRDYLCDLLGCKADCSEYEQLYRDAADDLIECSHKKAELQETIRQLELLVPRPMPPKLDYIVEKSDAWVETQLRNMGLNIIRLRLDNVFKITNRKNFINKILVYDTTDQLPYIKSIFDCEDFTFLFKVMMHLNFGVNQMAVILDYISGHAYGLVLFDDSEHLILEIQTDGIYVWTKRVKDFYSLEGAIALI